MPKAVIIASSGLGFLIGFIYFIDGWYFSSQPTNNILKDSYRLKSLIILVGGVVLSVLGDIFTLAGEEYKAEATIAYIIVLVVTIFLMIILTIIISFIVAYYGIKKARPSSSRYARVIESLPFIYVAVKGGFQYFKITLDKEYSLIGQLTKQRDSSVPFFNGLYSALIENNIQKHQGIREFSLFIERFLDLFIRNFLSGDDDKILYRACLYYYDQSKQVDRDATDKLYFFVGVHPKGDRHSLRPLSLKKSFAGRVISQRNFDNKNIYYYPGIDIKGNPFPFEKIESNSRYKSIAACIVPSLKQTSNSACKLILCIDCSEIDTGIFKDYGEYLKKMTWFLAYSFSVAQSSMLVSDEDIELFLRERYENS